MRASRLALFGHDELSLYGTAAMLDAERIPYHRVGTPQAALPNELLIVSGGDLSVAEIDEILRRPALVLHGGAKFAGLAFDRTSAEVEEGPVVLPLDFDLWPAALARRLRRFGQNRLTVPQARVCRIEREGEGVPSGWLVTPEISQPALICHSMTLYCPVDLGAAFAHLLDESYAPHSTDAALAFLRQPWIERAIQSLYYTIPAALRRRMQIACYERAERQLREMEWQSSEYPVDATGSILMELFKGLLVLGSGSLVRLARWPAPYQCAALMTHDIEPTRYAYGCGLPQLLRRQTAQDHPIFGLVARPCRRLLSDGTAAALARHDVLCHGLTHCAETVDGLAATTRRVREAKQCLEGRLGRRVLGYRSPRLDRSRDLLHALDQSGFAYDSSYPDCDRENIAHYGGGVRLNLPYRPPITAADGSLRPSRCLELPLASPDCIQPLFAGASDAALENDVRRKADFIRHAGGLHVALVHAGVFSDADSERREQHREFVAQQLRTHGTWMPRIGELIDWWCSRENLSIGWEDGVLMVRNLGNEAISGLRLIIEDADGARSFAVPAVAAAQSTVVALCELPLSGEQHELVLQ